MIEMYQTPAVCVCYGNWAYCSNARGMDGVESQVQTVVEADEYKGYEWKDSGTPGGEYSWSQKLGSTTEEVMVEVPGLLGTQWGKRFYAKGGGYPGQ